MPFVLSGDVDLNGVLSAEDARLALRACVGLERLQANGQAFYCADIDNSGVIEAADARLILRASVGLEKLEDWLITEFERENLWYTRTGELTGDVRKDISEYSHSQKIPVIAGQKLYSAFFADLPVKCAGAFFDVEGHWIAPLLMPTETDGVHAEEYRYAPADVTPEHMEDPTVKANGGLKYCKMHEITVPENACYLSINLNDGMKTVSSDSGTHVRTLKNVQSLSTLPMLGVTGSGNRVWRYGDPERAIKQDKKLYIIGASNASIDRAYASIFDASKAPDAADNNTIEPIVGFQEYLIPYYREVVTLAFSGCPYRYDSETDPRSIYMYLTGKTDPACAFYAEPQLYLGHKKNDLSDADEVLILANNNRLSKEEDLGTFDSRDIRTYCGAINLLVDHILAKNAGHKVDIRLCLRPGRPGTEFSALTNEAHRRIAEARGLKIADVSNIGITEENYMYYTYDSMREIYRPYGCHFNNLGNMKFGLALADVLLSDDPAAHTPTQAEQSEAAVTFIDDDTTSKTDVKRFHDLFDRTLYKNVPSDYRLTGCYAVEAYRLVENPTLTRMSLTAAEDKRTLGAVEASYTPPYNPKEAGPVLLQTLEAYEEEGFEMIFHCMYQRGRADNAHNTAYFIDGFQRTPENLKLIRHNITTGIRTLEKLGHKDWMKHWVTPYGATDSQIQSLARSLGFDSLIRTKNGYISRDTDTDRYSMPRWGYDFSYSDGRGTPENLKKVIDTAVDAHAWIIIMTHVNSWGKDIQKYTDGFREIVQHCIDRGVKIVRYSDGFEQYRQILSDDEKQKP